MKLMPCTKNNARERSCLSLKRKTIHRKTLKNRECPHVLRLDKELLNLTSTTILIKGKI
jgi:hypothetical protein